MISVMFTYKANIKLTYVNISSCVFQLPNIIVIF